MILQGHVIVALLVLAVAVTDPHAVAAADHREGNTPVHDPELGQIFGSPLFIPPFVDFSQSETSLAVHGRHLVGVYSTDAYNALDDPTMPRFSQIGASISSDGGRTWHARPLSPPSTMNFPSSNAVVDVDRRGTFHLATLALPSIQTAQSMVQVYRSTDGGQTWSEPTIIENSDAPGIPDKPWLAIGPHPVHKSRESIYLVWHRFFSPFQAELHLARSLDGGRTWTTSTIFAPQLDPDPTRPQGSAALATPAVDPHTGDLYIPFVRISMSDTDFLQMLVSHDGGDSFSLVQFNLPGGPDPTLVPFVQSGAFCDCGPGGFPLVIKAGPDVGGRFGLSRWVNASRLTAQPAFAARHRHLYLAYSSSTSPISGDPLGHSNVFVLRSGDGGRTWEGPVRANPDDPDEIQHVLPSLAIGENAHEVHVGYYTQHVDETIDVHLSASHDGGQTFPARGRTRVTETSFTLGPSNIPQGPPQLTYHPGGFTPCAQLGDYISVKSAAGKVYVLWADERNTVTHPPDPGDPLSGVTHPQPDVFFQALSPLR